MADHATPAPGPAGPGPAAPGVPARSGAIGLRLALAFLAVALVAIALVAGLTAVFSAADVSALAARQRVQLASAVAVAAAASWDRANSRAAAADLTPVLDLAARTGADVQVRNAASRLVASSPGFATHPGTQLSAPVMVHGRRVGEVVVRFSGSGLGGAEQSLRSALLRAIAGAAGLAALLALVTGLAVARRITRPVERIITVTRAMGGGDRAARVGPVAAPGELRELATAFDQMADTLDRQEQLRRDLVADVAHELRTPVAILQAGHEALLDGVVEATPDQLTSLRDEVLRLARMVDDLQTLAAADAATLHLSLRPCDLAEVTTAATDSLAGRFEAASLTVERQLAPAWVMADPRWLHQVVTNLLTNALKFTPAGGRVTVQTGTTSPSGNTSPSGSTGPSGNTGPSAVLRVTDTGTGIPAGELPHIFERFWRGRQAAQISGSGIGLAVAAELARAHRGQLTASSEPGRGTEMTLSLPAA
jgi:two-component system, OmpR family, sensor histidine kinase BaeS